MELILERNKPSKFTMTGTLYINKVRECYTLEDIPREVKIKGETAISPGTYKVIINVSNRFKKRMPLLLNVPDFEGIRIHSGNTNHDTEGCILVGVSLGKDYVGSSRIAFIKLMKKLEKAAKENEDIYITIINKF